MRKKNMMLAVVAVLAAGLMIMTGCATTGIESTQEVRFVVTDTMQSSCYDNEGNSIEAPEPGEPFYGQDAQYEGIIPSYTDNGDGTVTDDHTGLMWQQSPPLSKMSYDEALEYVEGLELGGYSDWRLPTIKESFSLAMLDGNLNEDIPYIDTEYFDFYYTEGEKKYTGSYWTSTVCRMPATNDYELMEKNYGFNWADGHLKSYGDGYTIDGESNGFSIPAGVRAVRGEEGVYGVNDFQDNGDGTITDRAASMMWTAEDSGAVNDDGSSRAAESEDYGLGRTWTDTLSWVEAMNEAEYLGYSDWRLPNAKELLSIVQYGQTEIPAIDTEYFSLSRPDCFIWTNTTCGDFPEMADYVAFGKGYGIDLAAGSEKAPERPMGEDAKDMGEASEDGAPRMGPPPAQNDETRDITASDETASDDEFVDVHGPGCMRADYKDTEGAVTQAPEASKTFWEELYGEEYPYPYDESNSVTEEDLTNSENAADYVVIYNYALLVRDVDQS